MNNKQFIIDSLNGLSEIELATIATSIKNMKSVSGIESGVINDSDIKIESYLKKTSGFGYPITIIRVTHIPTGIYAESSEERSNHKNRDVAITILKDKLLK